jgi:hypothetical protein
MIDLLERVFRRTMARYWWQARNTGVRYGIARVQAVIHAEIKSLSKREKTTATDLRINELDYVLYQIDKVIDHENK